ncbi:S8 family serine peptidase [Mucilaginibacter phyllosphaerae]|uniref:Peptidase S8 n=1 Tax=Mucilaginibacter phyllosphaerae TaxID=1812349 RepID=A0A4Y8AF12_9SPHI|nr:S8 family serine peptidase [Mucilaginibacter phyllosphaerae]MBB3969016.1 subtilisin family serine protease [Mucilaginibacter phyllosphaerae]TEW67367.1 peptidase S8 [Mucilaginibacter phyllosphaerae]GGH22932.1 peptidase S8 [Mucilaginibacter phyllosphaerae]
MYKIFKTITGAALSAALLISIESTAQVAPKPAAELPKNWHLMDLKTDGYFGISLNQAYLFVKGKKSKTVLIATIDSGIDTAQADLKPVLWTNTKEIPGNGIDDDKNGYIDDMHGWDFLGGPGGKCDFTETTEEVREYNKLKGKYEGLTTAPAGSEKEFAYWEQVKLTHDATISKSNGEIQQLQPVMNALMATSGYIKKALNLKSDASFKKADLAKITSKSDTVTQSKNVWNSVFDQQGGDDTNAKIINELSEYLAKLNNDVNPDPDARKRIVGDNPDVQDGKPYGNNLLKFADAEHGTGVAGLIGAVRNNKYGIDGVADNVRIMAIKAVPNGDEYDKDIANAIRYAVDNGARIINMSFGKKLSPHKAWVDDAFKYAASKNVLLVQASGNDNQDVDAKPQFPNDTFADGSGTDADNVISVGASADKLNENLAGTFSNYGKKNVDVFAPGVKVTSVNMDAEFNTADGTSFASPITAGVAALVLEYYPNLSAKQLKQVILESATPLTGTMVLKPGSTTEKVDFTTLSKTGGIVNAYKALLAASKLKPAGI